MGLASNAGHGQPAEMFGDAADVLMPSASAALYRREMLDEIGLFDENFFLYCEDTDLGLRARRMGWACAYVPDAEVEHHYSQSSGAASALKAWYVERNRLWVAVKNFPASMLWALPWQTATRYFWHLVYMLQNRGAAAQFRSESGGGLELAGMVFRAHWLVITHFGELRRKRRAIRKTARMTPGEFTGLLKKHSISGRKIAGQ